jgi:WD40 repeat protein
MEPPSQTPSRKSAPISLLFFLLVLTLAACGLGKSEGRKPDQVLERNSDWISSVVWNDEMLFSSGGNLHIWNTRNWELLHTVPQYQVPQQEELWIVGLLEASDWLLIEGSHSRIIWDTKTNSIVAAFPRGPGEAASVLLDNHLVMVSDYGIRTYDTSDFALSDSFILDSKVWVLHFDKLAVASTLGIVRLVDVKERKVVDELTTSLVDVTLLKWSPSGNNLLVVQETVSVSAISVWSVEQKSISAQRRVQGRVTQVVWSPDENMVAAAIRQSQSKMLIWNLTGEQDAFFPKVAKNADVQYLDWNPDNNRLAIGASWIEPDSAWNGYVWIWDRPSQNLSLLYEHPCPVTALAWNPAGDMLASGCTDGRVRIWNFTN